nr:uncharacterized protein K02A2.6-like [Halyomorpha halys]
MGRPNANWKRLHVDYGGPMNGFNFFLCIDTKSKWLEVRVVRDAPTTQVTINLLDDIFSNHGFPNQIVSDNASIFELYCKVQGISQLLIAPGHPATNGLAERSVQTLKGRLKAIASEPGTMSEKVQ